MSFRNALIRIAADVIFLVRKGSCTRNDLKILVFSGTAGKTLARLAVRHALSQSGRTVIALPYGYTNELGIVLALLGIEEPIRLHSLRGLFRVLTGTAPKDAYVCIELGADWRSDTTWFTDRLAPHMVFLTDLDTVEWARPLRDILEDKGRLLAALSPEGPVILGRANPSLATLRSLARTSASDVRLVEFDFSDREVEILEGDSTRAVFRPRHGSFIPAHREALGHAITCLLILTNGTGGAQEVIDTYEPPSDRIRVSLQGGITVVSDTYKAVPYCVRSTLQYALSLPARRRIVVLSAMHPLLLDVQGHYARIAELLQDFDELYFVGPERAFGFLRAHEPRLQRVRPSGYAALAEKIRMSAVQGTQVTIKAAGRYRLAPLAEQIRLQAERRAVL
ncbi:MAG: UDP-N-acetylmuramoyl-tripeptide--D-alanyl-D-alanine ligase [Candidatus Parcubacteria bacterium]|jgi:UDP-N-acetylmuramyl pentapeptide synthase|nr:UDP-N-acetylmuramoyl-tripeptide--D-alanyl-D-alanine ligase [Candidatus Parcubacteria bacterium]